MIHNVLSLGVNISTHRHGYSSNMAKPSRHKTSVSIGIPCHVESTLQYGFASLIWQVEKMHSSGESSWATNFHNWKVFLHTRFNFSASLPPARSLVFPHSKWSARDHKRVALTIARTRDGTTRNAPELLMVMLLVEDLSVAFDERQASERLLAHVAHEVFGVKMAIARDNKVASSHLKQRDATQKEVDFLECVCQTTFRQKLEVASGHLKVHGTT